MTSLDPRYVIAPSLEMYFVNKDTGLPLSGGVVTFYRDIARTELKPVYKLSGTAPNYSYTALPNPCILSAVGTFQDDTGADIIPYYFPYDDAGNVDLYYITVTSSSPDLIPQFTREAWPNIASNGPNSSSEIINFIPNPQFWPHNDNFPESSTITLPVTQVAPGGWSYNRSVGSTAVDKITFDRIGSAVSNPVGNPRYAISIENVTPGGEAFKDLRVTFKDVNTFSSSSQQYTFYIEGQSQTMASVTAQLYVIKNFGAGGDTQTETLISTFVFGGTYSAGQASFVFGSNIGKIIGTGDDDFVALALRLPTNASFKVDFTDAILTLGAITITDFPPTTVEDMNLRSIFGEIPTPAHDGSDFYLPLVIGQTGVLYDYSQVGKVFSTLNSTVGPGELACNGQKVITSKHSVEGIPYTRLHAVLLASSPSTAQTLSIPVEGTGDDYSTCFNLVNNVFTLVNNTLGSTTASSAGTSGFTITTSHTGANYFSSAYSTSSGFFYLINSSDISPTAQTSGFSIGIVRTAPSPGSQPYSITQIGTTGPAGLGGKFFNFDAYNAGDVPYYIWYQVDGAGTDPAPGGRTGILVQVNSTDTLDGVAQKTRLAINGFQETNIVVGVVPAASSYFTFNSTGDGYYVWFEVDSVGADPAIAGRTGLKVSISSTATLPEIAGEIIRVLNTYSYKIIDLRGAFIRGVGGTDPDPRMSIVPEIYGQVVGTIQFDETEEHAHSYELLNQVFLAAGGDNSVVNFASVAGTTGVFGSRETRPANTALNYVIKI